LCGAGDEVSCSKSRDIERGFKAVPCGSPRTTSGVGIIVSERFRDSIERLYHFFSAYAPLSGCSDHAKEEFWSLLDEKTAEVPPKDVIIVAGDLSGHVGAAKDGYSCHDGFGYGSRHADGERILEYAESHNLTIVNTVFRKRGFPPYLIL
uniref:Endo/exonuclease/phosphatase domain-containing protein n=1 Tax=Heligmosomoides polygyrus TaxID=6339 RepID=A0A183G2W8_HELPZ